MQPLVKDLKPLSFSNLLCKAHFKGCMIHPPDAILVDFLIFPEKIIHPKTFGIPFTPATAAGG